MQISKDIAAVSRYLRRQRNRYMEPLGLKGVHGRYLIEICQNSGISQDGLSQRLGFDKSNVARQAALLEEDGFIRRVPDQADKRVLRLYPTERTLELLPKLQQAMDRWENTLTQDLTTEEKERLTALLARVRARAMEEEAD